MHTSMCKSLLHVVKCRRCLKIRKYFIHVSQFCCSKLNALIVGHRGSQDKTNCKLMWLTCRRRCFCRRVHPHTACDRSWCPCSRGRIHTRSRWRDSNICRDRRSPHRSSNLLKHIHASQLNSQFFYYLKKSCKTVILLKVNSIFFSEFIWQISPLFYRGASQRPSYGTV